MQTCAALFAAGALLSSARADEWEEFYTQRISSPGGRHYAIVRETSKPSSQAKNIEFAMYRRRAGVAPLPNLAYPPRSRRIASVAADPADELLVRGAFPQLPYRISVLDERVGLVLFDRHGGRGYGATVVLLDGTGRPAFQLERREIFAAESRHWSPSVSSLHWGGDHWIDEARESIVVVEMGFEAREISLVDGTVRAPSIETLIAAFASSAPATRELALDVAAKCSGPDLQIAGAVALPLARDAALPLATRIRAAGVAARAGHGAEFASFFQEALTSLTTDAGSINEDRVARYATAALGVHAVPSLLERLRGQVHVFGAALDCFAGLAYLGAAGVPGLTEAMLGSEFSWRIREEAALTLGELSNEAALDALVRGGCADDARVANCALRELRLRATHDVRERYFAVLAAGSLCEAQIAAYFQEHPGTDALPWLERALLRTYETKTREALHLAVRACRDRVLSERRGK